jgi:uncharacterized surface protein with fasciclin (FAS1) repeats
MVKFTSRSAHWAHQMSAYAFLASDSELVTDETGGVATVTVADVIQLNGVIHVIDKVLLPKK